MKRVVFVVSHLRSGSAELVYLLNQNDRIDIRETHTQYGHPTHLNILFDSPHKCRSAAAIYGDHLLYNINFQCKRLYDWCSFIYVIRSAKDALPDMTVMSPLTDTTVYRYYCFRIRRIYEMAKRTKNAVLLTWNDLQKGLTNNLLEEYLNLKSPISIAAKDYYSSNPCRSVPIDSLEKAQDCFEYYLYKMRNLDHLRMVSQ